MSVCVACVYHRYKESFFISMVCICIYGVGIPVELLLNENRYFLSSNLYISYFVSCLA